MTVPPAPVRVPSQRSLAPGVTSVTSVANYKNDVLKDMYYQQEKIIVIIIIIIIGLVVSVSDY